MKRILIFLLLVLSAPGFAQTRSVVINRTQLPLEVVSQTEQHFGVQVPDAVNCS